MNQVECAYLAGIIDGEGCFTIVKHKNNTSRGWRYEPCLSVSNTDERLLRWIQKATHIGSIYSKEYKNRRNKLCWVWQVYKIDDIADVINFTIEYLLVKFQVALLLGEFCLAQFLRLSKWQRQRDEKGRFIKHELPYFGRQHEIYRELKELNHS